MGESIVSEPAAGVSPALEIRNLWKAYGGRPAVLGLNMTVAPGEIHGLIGPNGAGKTTTLKILMGLLRQDYGSVRVFGTDILQDAHGYKARVGYLPEAPTLPDFLTGEEFLGALARIRGFPAEVARQRVHELLAQYDLAERPKDLIVSYSKGMRQKLAICAANLHRPALLVVDEPLVGMDPLGQRQFKTSLRPAGGSGPAVLLSTHMLDTAERLCDHVTILHRGQAVASGGLDALRRGAQAGQNASLEEVFLKLTEEASQPEPPAPPPKTRRFGRFGGGG
jgi:ABC-2 type transport system ATP-binding protein